MAQTFVYNSGTYQEPNSGTIDLEFGLFFDGTLNSFENTKLRLTVLNQNDLKILPSDDEKEVKRKEEELKYRRSRISDELFEFLIPNAYIRNIENSRDITDYRRADERGFFDRMGVDNSLMNDYSNVARMWQCCNESYAIYIEGIGTLDRQEDIKAGFQFGSGDTGIRGKVRRGCYELAKKINKELPKETDEVIKVTLDVFGFSRGAAAARNFLYEVNVSNKREEDTKLDKRFERTGKRPYDERSENYYNEYAYFYYDKDSVRVNIDFFEEDKWPKYGYLGYYLLKEGINPKILDKIRLEIRFVGIYDTVSSYEEFGNISGLDLLDKGIQHSKKSFFDDDVEQLQLNNLGKFQKAVHFTAMNEHRENFALTKMRVENCIEKAFPGVHCDIGGAYETGTEYVDEIDNSNHNSGLDTFCEDLISQYWYKREQLNLSFFKLSGTRFLRKEYSYIPLHFMQQFFNEILGNSYTNVISENVVTDYPISDPQDEILIKVKERLRKYVFRDENKKEEERSEEEKEWRFLPDEKVKKLLQEEGRKVIDEIKSKRRKEQEKKKKEDQNMLLLEGGTYKKTVTFDSEPKINYAKVLQEVYKRNPMIETQDILRILRNKYLHWSANRDWFAMEPTPDRIRKEY